jgi:hypothetical protein
MIHRLFIVSILTGALCCFGQVESDSEPATPSTSSTRNSGLIPPWLKLGAEFRTRVQFTRNAGFEAGESENFLLTRLRLDFGIEPNNWLRFKVQAQDAHAPGLNGDLDSVANAVDIRQAFVEVGQSQEAGWMFRFGRQELSYGDERLLGSDSFWDPLGPTFDAARISWAGPRIRLEGFAALPLESRYHGFDRGSKDNRLFGFYSTLNPGPAELAVEPFVLWKSTAVVSDDSLYPGRTDVYTYGVRSHGPLLTRADYNVEMALQRGRRASQPIRAWAGHWELGYGLGADSRAAIEYNFGSGDSNPSDGHHGAFDELYPAAYDGYGMEDPFPWINIRSVAANADLAVTRAWRLNVGYRSLFLASTNDGLYSDAESWLVRSPHASSSHLGNQIFVQCSYQFSPRWQLWLAVARLMPGAYLRESSFNGPLTTPYLTLSYRF